MSRPVTDAGTLARRWFYEVWNQRRADSIDELLAPDCVAHLGDGDHRGIPAVRKFHAKYLRAIPDLTVDVEDVIADGARSAVRWRFHGTHAGPGLGVAPSGRPVDVRGISWIRVVDGKIAEAWDSWNFDGFIRALSAPRDD